MEHQLYATITILLISKISSTCFGWTFAHLQERKTEIFTTYGIMSCKNGNTKIYVVYMCTSSRYNKLVCVYCYVWVLLLLYTNVYGIVVGYVVVREFIFWVRWLLGKVMINRWVLICEIGVLESRHLVGVPYYIT
jgi:hypothetical protein